MRRRAGKVGSVAALAALCAGPALGSGGPPAEPLYITAREGTDAELSRRSAGRLGLVMPAAREGLLYLDWRLLHDQRVGEEAGNALAVPCCDDVTIFDTNGGVFGWLEARKAVPGVPESPYWLSTERAGPDYTTIPNCFPDAFDTAKRTLEARIARYGRGSAAVKNWLLTQDKVFETCSTAGVALPPLMPDAPAWLKADRAYQEAARALYDGRNVEAAERFGAIARDGASPWQPMALYLRTRATHREALARPSPDAYAAARAEIARLAAAPEGTYGRGEAKKMLRVLDYRERPEQLIVELEEELARKDAGPDIASAFKDYVSLNEKAGRKPPVLDWMRTMRPEDRAPALAHAAERWTATRDQAWLLAALSLAKPTDAAAAQLAAEAARVPYGDRAWLTARYHLVRLTIDQADPALTRARLDAMLAAPGLTLSERNLFTGARAQVAAGLEELARLSLRGVYCAAYDGDCADTEDFSYVEGVARSGSGYVVFGAEARALIDRLPLRSRIAFSRLASLPRELRLDVALTNFARAVQLRDEAALGAVARDLVPMLPQLAADWRTIAAARPGPARRFAIAFALSKLPGLRTDLTRDYRRPVGTVREFQGYWQDWLTLRPGAAAGPPEFPAPTDYHWWATTGLDETSDDLTCLSQCGRGAFPLHLPPFLAAVGEASAAERRTFVEVATEGAEASSLWEEALAYARSHPRDARVPELLHRLIRVDRWGAAPDQLGKRAFQLIHARYAGTVWAKRSPYYYD